MKKGATGSNQFTKEVSNEVAQEFYHLVYDAASKQGTDVRVKLAKDDTLRVQEINTKNIA